MKMTMNNYSTQLQSAFAKAFNNKLFICRVCNKSIPNMYKHLQEVGKDQKHKQFEEKTMAEGLHHVPCYCGGDIFWTYVSEDGGVAECNQCDLVWQEI